MLSGMRQENEYEQLTAFVATMKLLANYSHAKENMKEPCRYVLWY